MEKERAISVNDELPDEGTKVLVYDDEIPDWVSIGYLKSVKSNAWRGEDGYSLSFGKGEWEDLEIIITHWRPLPLLDGKENSKSPKCLLCKQNIMFGDIQVRVKLHSFLCKECYATVPAKLWDGKVKELEGES